MQTVLDEENLKPEVIATVVAPFERVTTLMSGAKYPTVSMIIPVLNELKQSLWRIVVNGAGQEVTDLCHALVASIDKRWPNYEQSELYAASTLLDPRYKDCAFLDAGAAVLAKHHVSSVAQKIENSQKIAATTAATGSLTDLMEQSEMKAECSSWEWLWKKAAQKMERARAVPQENAVQRELEIFLAAPNIPVTGR